MSQLTGTEEANKLCRLPIGVSVNEWETVAVHVDDRETNRAVGNGCAREERWEGVGRCDGQICFAVLAYLGSGPDLAACCYSLSCLGTRTSGFLPASSESAVDLVSRWWKRLKPFMSQSVPRKARGK